MSIACLQRLCCFKKDEDSGSLYLVEKILSLFVQIRSYFRKDLRLTNILVSSYEYSQNVGNSKFLRVFFLSIFKLTILWFLNEIIEYIKDLRVCRFKSFKFNTNSLKITLRFKKTYSDQLLLVEDDYTFQYFLWKFLYMSTPNPILSNTWSH